MLLRDVCDEKMGIVYARNVEEVKKARPFSPLNM